jgi:hypothetical protein
VRTQVGALDFLVLRTLGLKTLDKKKREALEKEGFIVGDYVEFLDLNTEEQTLVDQKYADYIRHLENKMIQGMGIPREILEGENK